MGLFSTMMFMLTPAWSNAARDSLVKIRKMIIPFVGLRLPISCIEVTDWEAEESIEVAYVAIAFAAATYTFFLKDKTRETKAKYEMYIRYISESSPFGEEVVRSIQNVMATKPRSYTHTWSYVSNVGYNEDAVSTVMISEWLVRTFCRGEEPSNLERACKLVEETIYSTSRMIVI